MAKYYGSVGYVKTKETRPGVHEEIVTERNYYGDVIQNLRKLASSEGVNDNVDISNIISIVADPYAMDNFFNIRYVIWMGAKFKVKNVEVQFPRLRLLLGGLYNDGEET